MSGGAVVHADVAAARLSVVTADLVEIRRAKAELDAREAHALAEAARVADEWAIAEGTRSEADLARRAVAAELAAALRVSDRTVQRQMADAERMIEAFPDTVASLTAGKISIAHARVIVDAGARITRPELRAEYEDSVLPYAEAESASRLRPVAKRRAEWFLDETIQERHTAANTLRHVRVTDLDDGMAELAVTGSAVLIHGIHNRLTQMAHEVTDADAATIQHARDTLTATRKATTRDTGPGEPTSGCGTAVEQAEAHLEELLRNRRTIDAIRADLLADMLLTADPTAHTGTTGTGLAAIHATVQVTVPVLSLLGTPVEDPFDATTLTGHGPIHPDTARTLAGHAPGWDRILTHPITGDVLTVDRYQPSNEMRRTLRIRDQHCRFPACRQPATRTDLDHTIDWQHGGTTTTTNLAHLCRRHHTLKHHTPWTVTQKPGGTLKWTSPTGRHYTDHPTSRIHFTTDPETDTPTHTPAPF
ncbi:DUF222 domain-containing protein [Microbacterium sp. SSW1-59]|uniref:HNH endonuclease n=1 Tax=Microbacterium xanthum TaxID=3079794 RepID=UPI002AD4BFC2|nr:DUF222 domain-containing protein [Microbacterium sp. SSW1-59]MDZ8200432.1 DUF222 domain-containing protein [Microbacterium sp. SSW1-59]